MGGCQLCLYRVFCSLFEAKRKVFNLIFNFNPLKYVGDLDMNRVNLAEDPSYGSKVISFNYWLPREFKACHLNYLSIPATSCNLLIFSISFYWSKIFRKVTSYEWVKRCDYYRQGRGFSSAVAFFRTNKEWKIFSQAICTIASVVTVVILCNNKKGASSQEQFQKILENWQLSQTFSF